MSWRTVAHVVIVLALAWRLIASLVGVAVEIGADDSYGRSLGERFAAIDEPNAIRRRRSLGVADEILLSVEQHVPPEGAIAVLPPGRRNKLVSRALLTTLWPRRIDSFEHFATTEIEQGFAAGRPLFVLALDADQSFAGRERCVELAGSRDFRLWRAEEAVR